MVRIPKNEQTVGYGAQMQPFSSGDGYEAPGKAQQQLGKAIQSFGGQIASLGEAFDAGAEKEDAYRTQLTSLEYDDKLDRDLTEYKMTADPEKWDTYAAGAAERVGRITQEYMPKLSQKGQQQFSLHAARRHNQIMSSSREHQYDLQRKNLFTRSSAGIDSIAERLYTRYPIESWNREAADGIYVPPDPQDIAANAAAALQTQEAIISKYPGTPQQRDMLRKQALDALGKFVTNNVPPAWQEQVGSAIDARLRASAPPEAPVVPGTTPESTMHRWGGQSGQGQMPTYRPGRVSATYESGGRGVGFVSSGRGDPGGQSYGIHQLSTKDSMGAFLRASEGQTYADKFKGLRPGTDAFNQVYKSIAAADPQGFANAQYAFYSRTHYDPVKAHAQKLGFAVDNPGVQEALFSMGVQHGGARRIVSAAAAAANKGPAEQIQALYEARSAYVKRIDLPEQTRASVLNRYRSEVRDALAMVGSAGNDQVANRQEPQNDNIRAPNTIPAEAGGDQAPVRVADAGGGIPQSAVPGAVPGSQPRMLPSGERGVGSHYNEWWREHQAAFRKTQASAIDKLVDQVEASAKETFIHPAAEQIRQQVQYLGDTKMLERLDRAVAGAKIAQGMRAMRPDQVNMGVQQLRSQMGPEATPEQIARLKLLEGVSSTMNTELSKDQLGWAAKAGVIPAPKLIAPETMSVEGLAERAILARQSAANYGMPPQFFQPEEETRLKAVVEQGGKPLAVMLGMMSKGFGPDMPLAVKQIAKERPEAEVAGWLMANNLNPETAQAIVDGIARRNGPNYKAVTAAGQRTNQEKNLQDVLGDVYHLYPQEVKDRIMAAADLVYETKNRKPQEYDEKLFKKIVNELTGQNQQGSVTYGGVYSQDRSVWSDLKSSAWPDAGGGGKNNIILPPHISNNDSAIERLKLAIATLTPAEMAEAGITPPTTVSGRPMDIRKALAGKLVQADTDHQIGRYTLALGDPSDQNSAGWVLTTPRPFEPFNADETAKRAVANEGRQMFGVSPLPEEAGDTAKAPPWGSEKATPLAPTQRWVLDLRRESALSEVLRRKLGREIMR